MAKVRALLAVTRTKAELMVLRSEGQLGLPPGRLPTRLAAAWALRA